MRVAFGRFTFDTETRELLDAGARVHLSPKAFDLLALLLDRRPTVVSKREIHDHVWQDTFVGEANLSVVIAEIRQVLGDDSRQASFVRTVHRVGYAFSGPAQTLAAVRPETRTEERLCWLVRNDHAFPLAAGENVVGRDPRCDVWVEASGVSRRHACVDVGTDKTTIADLESSNGTFVAGERIAEPRILADGDVVELGAATLTFRAWSDERSARTERVVRAPRDG
ncbi:Transcriptional regulator HilA [Luteitalea pratensis]|uniref:Transcriptional regulator HilA n=1 Tax=Luteitalea pratensis TaxID=1855912 RepID=A0A143PLH8_LUTPR|nr:FHA domain-containing protein [Luteitalea pratensis]AMY08644.1 Transcriptional regulator HilA [Luteitalea pratensis]